MMCRRLSWTATTTRPCWIPTSALLSSKIAKGSTLKVYTGLPHGTCSTHKDQGKVDLLTFFKA